MSISSETMMFKRTEDKKDVAQTIREVYAALEENAPSCAVLNAMSFWKSL